MVDSTIIYTDGSAVNSDHNKGGYGIVIIRDDVIRQFAGGSYINTTSARMEIMAVLKALQKCEPGENITVYSDNEYVVNALEKKWLLRWVEENFRGRANKDLWELFMQEYFRLDGKIKMIWVRGHDGNEYNEIADQLASIGANRKIKIKDKK